MAMSEPCGRCKKITSFICAAQFHGKNEDELIICYDCWNSGYRCFDGSDGLIVALTCPEGYETAKLYYDEGAYVTQGEIPVEEWTYFNAGVV